MKPKKQSYFKNEKDLLNLAEAFQKSKIFLTASEIGIFTYIPDEGISDESLAEAIGLEKRALSRLLNALCSINLLEKKQSLFFNTDVGKKYLIKDCPDYIGNLGHLTHMWDTWGQLTSTIRNGKALANKRISEKSDKWIASYIDSMHNSYLHEAKKVVSNIKLRDVSSILDLGCGSGLYSIEFMKQKPDLAITCYDFENVLTQSKAIIDASGVAGNVTYQAGDFTEAIEGKYDMIFASFIFDEYSIWDNISIMQKCYEALNRGGRLIVHENIIDDKRTSPQESVFYSITMLLNTLDGDAYAENDFWIMLREAGFPKVERMDTDAGTSLVIAVK